MLVSTKLSEPGWLLSDYVFEVSCAFHSIVQGYLDTLKKKKSLSSLETRIAKQHKSGKTSREGNNYSVEQFNGCQVWKMFENGMEGIKEMCWRYWYG